MPEGGSEQRQAADADLLDRLLAGLRTRSRMDPPAALRSRLAQLSEARLIPDRGGRRLSGMHSRRFLGLAAALSALSVGAILIGFWIDQKNPPASTEHTGTSSSQGSSAVAQRRAPAVSSPAGSPRNESRGTMQMTLVEPRNLVFALPYSSGAVATGTGATIPISISQNQLAAMGFPAQPTAGDRRVAANLILGDDGLPRAISVPFMPAATRGTE